ncbi:MAG: hypothetical protein KC983_06235, partial [Phycisphaerales bacterium]|nr:hypothetical protein [Phycisphaerales bacterium]
MSSQGISCLSAGNWTDGQQLNRMFWNSAGGFAYGVDPGIGNRVVGFRAILHTTDPRVPASQFRTYRCNSNGTATAFKAAPNKTWDAAGWLSYSNTIPTDGTNDNPMVDLFSATATETSSTHL